MAIILPFKPRQLARVKSDRRQELERHGQLNLFAGAPARLITLPTRLSPFLHATLLHERGDAGAAGAYEVAIREGDRADDAYVNLGVLEYESGRLDGAFSCFRECLKINPAHFEAHYNLGHLYASEGALRPAEIHYEVASSICPGEPEVLFSLGALYAELGRLDEAIDALRLYRGLVPDDSGAKADELINELAHAAARAR